MQGRLGVVVGVVALVQACNQREREREARESKREQEKQERDWLLKNQVLYLKHRKRFQEGHAHSYSHEEQEKAEYLDDDHHACHEAVVGAVGEVGEVGLAQARPFPDALQHALFSRLVAALAAAAAERLFVPRGNVFLCLCSVCGGVRV